MEVMFVVDEVVVVVVVVVVEVEDGVDEIVNVDDNVVGCGFGKGGEVDDACELLFTLFKCPP